MKGSGIRPQKLLWRCKQFPALTSTQGSQDGGKSRGGN